MALPGTGADGLCTNKVATFSLAGSKRVGENVRNSMTAEHKGAPGVNEQLGVHLRHDALLVQVIRSEAALESKTDSTEEFFTCLRKIKSLSWLSSTLPGWRHRGGRRVAIPRAIPKGRIKVRRTDPTGYGDRNLESRSDVTPNAAARWSDARKLQGCIARLLCVVWHWVDGPVLPCELLVLMAAAERFSTKTSGTEVANRPLCLTIVASACAGRTEQTAAERLA
ncbi:uncharacterized protein [Anser cygnoides]|uniref:uncharacterized protein isoform X2 n=1 Tax=Anser cygnoides TaxID=8845 RepID=UPI0034D16129